MDRDVRAHDPEHAPTAAEARRWLRQMIEIRLFDDRVGEMFTRGLVPGTVHLSIGQEAVSVGAVAAMGPDDQLTVTFRGHGQALARGVTMEAGFAELTGRDTGCCHGLGGSMHFTDYSIGLIGAFAIVGAGMPVAVGAAMAAKLKGESRVVLSFCGDGAVNIGSFHEAMNMAAIWRAPVVFIVENNLYGEYTPMRETAPSEDVADRAAAYRMPAVIVDGQDVGAVHGVVSEAIRRARTGGGPTLVEAKTYRYRGHARSDPAKYRPPEEVAAWKARDPIDLLAAELIAAGDMTAEDLSALWAEVQADVDAATARVAGDPWPSIDGLKSWTYAE
jgi:acetoin:2,6-dichlorophenolindophenol oxidoreductase subunit alpha